MNIQVTVRHMETSPNVRDRIDEEMQKLQKFTDRITSCHVILDSEHVNKTVEILIGVKRRRISAKARSDNVGKALDMAIEKIKKQLVKLNKKSKEHKENKSTKDVMTKEAEQKIML